jgi:hypothetical protein
MVRTEDGEERKVDLSQSKLRAINLAAARYPVEAPVAELYEDDKLVAALGGCNGLAMLPARPRGNCVRAF